MGLNLTEENGLEFLSIEWNLIKLDDPTHGIVTKTVHKTLTGHFFCLFRTWPITVIVSQISSKFTGEVVYYQFCIPLLMFSVLMLSIAQDLRSK